MIGLTILDLIGYCSMVCYRAKRDWNWVGAHLAEGIAAYQEVSWVGSPWRTDHFPNSSIYLHEDLRSFQNTGSLESIKSMRLLMANLQIYSGRHFFPGTKKLMYTMNQNIQWPTTDEHKCWAKGTQGLKRDQKRHCCPTAECTSATTKGKVSPLHTAWPGTAKLRFLGLSFSVAQAECFSLCPTPSTHLHTVFLLAMCNSIDSST